MRAPRVNRVMLTGRATRDPELRYLPSGVPVSRIPLAFDRWVRDAKGQWERSANYITAVATGPRALRLQEQLKKGGALYVEGELQTHHWTGPEGVTRSSIEIRVDGAQVLGTPEGEELPPGPGEDATG